MDVSKDVSAAQKSFAIKNTKSMLVCWGIILGCLYIMHWFYKDDNGDVDWLIYAVPAFLVFLAFLRFLAIKDGIVVSPERNKFEFYGGAMAASNFSDFLSPSWLLQFFKRYSWDLDSITSCKKDYKRLVSKSGTVHELYYLCVSSTKGNVKIELSEGKVDEAIAVLVSVRDMGKPILNR